MMQGTHLKSDYIFRPSATTKKSRRNPDERSDILGSSLTPTPHIAPLRRATRYSLAGLHLVPVEIEIRRQAATEGLHLAGRLVAPA